MRVITHSSWCFGVPASTGQRNERRPRQPAHHTAAQRQDPEHRRSRPLRARKRNKEILPLHPSTQAGQRNGPGASPVSPLAPPIFSQVRSTPGVSALVKCFGWPTISAEKALKTRTGIGHGMYKLITEISASYGLSMACLGATLAQSSSRAYSITLTRSPNLS